MPKVVAFTSLIGEPARLLFGAAPPGYDVAQLRPSLDDGSKAAVVRDADFLILFPGSISETVLRAAGRLKLIQLVSAGYEGMPLSVCRELGIDVANNGGSNAIDVAEHTLALVLAFYRRLTELDRRIRGEPGFDSRTGETTYTIDGKLCGIVGFGNIGRRVARLFTAFGADVIYADAVPAPEAVENELGVQRESLHELLRESDVVTLHVPLTSATRGLIGARELGLMKPSAVLVNTCRGPVVDEPALVDALRAQRLRGACLDVLTQEPPAIDNPLLTLDNVLLTPHTAGITFDTWERRGRFIFENLNRVWEGQEPLARVLP
ncbi:lactate dehydrogenase [Candidatus Poribacteria bacterium]|nr:lactate dehydrogenase [Candidatus Poribacteria bacterium]